MKRILSLIVFGLAIAVMLSFAVSHDPGYVRITIGHWLIESNLWVMLGLNIVVLCTLSLCFRMFRGFRYSKGLFRRMLGPFGVTRAQQNTEQGLIALLEGNWRHASRLLTRSASKSDRPLINYLAAAHAAHELGDIKEAEQHLKKAYENTSDSEFAVGIAQAQIQLQQNQLEQCLATLLRLKKQQVNHPFVSKLLKTVYLKLEDWQQLLNLIPTLRKYTQANDGELLSLERLAWEKSFIQRTDELMQQNNLSASADVLAVMWKKIPDTLRFDSLLIENYAKQLIRLKSDHECEVLLRKALGKQWDDTLVKLYGLVRGKNLSEQLTHAETWLKQKPNNPILLLTLGRLSLRNELWGKALEYFNVSASLLPSTEVYAEINRLSLKLNKNDQALLNDLIASLALPELPLPK
ncbi:MAG: HemY protein [Oleiphilaceae bacterium]|jgi:HemY protein